MKQLEAVSEQQAPVYALHEEATAEQAPTLRDFLVILKRRRSIALQAFIAVVALGIVVTLMTKPVYRSTSRVLVEGKSAVMTINNSTNPLSGLFLPSSGHETETQVEILRSSDISRKAYKESGLAPGRVFLEVKRVANTDVIELSTTSNVAAAAFLYLKAIPVVYLRAMRTDQMREVTAAYDFARRRLKEENARLKKSELALQVFRTKAGVVDADSQRNGDVAAAMTARTAVGEAEGMVGSLTAQLQDFLATRSGMKSEIVNPTTTTNTDELNSLRQKIADLRSQRQDALYQYKENDDEIRIFDRKIADLQRRLDSTPANQTSITRLPNPAIPSLDAKIADVRASLRAAEANLRQARARVTSLNAGLTKYNPIERAQGQLARDIASSSGIVASLTQSAEELALRKKALESANAPITVIEAASEARKISPNALRNLILSIALGVLMACAAAMLQESLDDHMRDEDEVRRMLGAPILGHFPLMAEGRSALPAILRAAQKRELQNKQLSNANGSSTPFDRERERDMDGYAVGPDRNLLERFRVLRSNVQFTQIDRTHTTMMVTSTVPQEGKSYTAHNLAAAMALDGRRVILIDADLHRPRQHTEFDVPVQPGLTNVLVGQALLKDCLHETGINGLRLLTAGVLPPNPVELLNSPSMDAVMEALKAEADLLIFDTPPVLATADAQVLASKVDGVLYVMQLGSVPKSAVARSFELLEQARANILGIALNKIGSESNYSGYYSGYYGESESSKDGKDGDDSGLNGRAPADSEKADAHA